MKTNQPVGNTDTFGKSELNEVMAELSDVMEFAAQLDIHIGASFIPSEVYALDRRDKSTIAWYSTFTQHKDRDGVEPCKTPTEFIEAVQAFVVEQAGVLEAIRLTPIQ